MGVEARHALCASNLANLLKSGAGWLGEIQKTSRSTDEANGHPLAWVLAERAATLCGAYFDELGGRRTYDTVLNWTEACHGVSIITATRRIAGQESPVVGEDEAIHETMFDEAVSRLMRYLTGRMGLRVSGVWAALCEGGTYDAHGLRLKLDVDGWVRVSSAFDVDYASDELIARRGTARWDRLTLGPGHGDWR